MLMTEHSLGRRIVNIINFVRGCEPRVPSRDLLEPVMEQVRLIKQHRLPATFLLQYDVLLQPEFVEFFLSIKDDQIELGVWLEVVEPLTRAAGIPWRGRYPWDWHASVDFSIGYSPKERERLVDTLMSRFNATFGAYPLSMGSWVIDAHSLAYAHEHFGVIASCNCKDQVGTDGYTLWGGYYNQAYYPSKMNNFMPAQHAEQQINVPVFRMLGSDPIYQYDLNLGKARQSVITLEPACAKGGAIPEWVRWYFNVNNAEPILNFSYNQVGQENSFGWPAMGTALTYQLEYVADQVGAGRFDVETLADSARWFRKTFPLTPATAITVLNDWQNQGRRSVWYNSRNYRVNLYWEDDMLRVRDIHLFDERYAERYLTEVCTTPTCIYDTLPVMDGFLWSSPEELAGIRPILCGDDGTEVALIGNDPSVTQVDAETIQIHWPLAVGGVLDINCSTQTLSFVLPDQPTGVLGLKFTFWSEAPIPSISVQDEVVSYTYNQHSYSLKVA
jgi:hypothetical protein